MALKRVVFIRPGETDWNKDKRQQGWIASPLNKLGKLQVERLANFVRHIGITALYSSDLKRAVQTAELLSEKLGYPAVFDARLRERGIGQWQGMTLDELRRWYPDEHAQLVADVDEYQVPGGESRSQVRARMRSAFDDIVAAVDGETVAIVSHTTAIRALLGELIPNSGDTTTMQIDNSSVTTIRLRDGVWELVALDDIEHLEGLETRFAAELEQEHDPSN